MNTRAGITARSVAFEVLQRIENSGAFANLVLGPALERSGLDTRDRAFCTQLVYGTTRMARACDYLIDRFAEGKIDPKTRIILRLGAYQIHYLKTPDHAAVHDTVELASRKAKGFVNAILRNMVRNPLSQDQWPDDVTRLSYPDWILDTFTAEHGRCDALAAAAHMNLEPEVHIRDDGYTQDLGSRWVVDVLDPQPGDVIADVCSAPGGKATLIAARGATVIAADRRVSRAKLVRSNIENTQSQNCYPLISDARSPALAHKSFDRVLVDAPCSGLGVLRRRADARWRIEQEAPQRLAQLQKEILHASAELVKPSGFLCYSLCTITKAETIEVAQTLDAQFTPIAIDSAESRWRKWGTGGVILPQDHNTDAMAVFLWQRN